MVPLHPASAAAGKTRFGTLLRVLGAAAGLLFACPALADEGIRFVCRPAEIVRIASEMDAYLAASGIAPGHVVKHLDMAAGIAVYTLNTPDTDVNTLNLQQRTDLAVGTEYVSLPAGGGQQRQVETVSKKEILLALLQHGRLTDFRDAACDLDALRDQVGIRQNTVAWAETLEWVWPDGGYSEWNGGYWLHGTPRATTTLQDALNDVFFHQDKYAIGCYTATKFVMIQGVLDYYARVRKNPDRLQIVLDRLHMDGDPLVSVEPGRMWAFEKGISEEELAQPGKILKIADDVAAKNFVPGDWVYFLNTDAVTQEKTGYEGSNAIYLGRNRFDDYYNDHDHFYTYEEKMNEVYQWRHGVFSRTRDADKVRPLHADDYERLGQTPEDKGMVLDIRVAPYFFGFEDLP